MSPIFCAGFGRAVVAGPALEEKKAASGVSIPRVSQERNSEIRNSSASLVVERGIVPVPGGGGQYSTWRSSKYTHDDEAMEKNNYSPELSKKSVLNECSVQSPDQSRSAVYRYKSR